MSEQTPRRVAVWIDHHAAIIATFIGERLKQEEELLPDLNLQDHGRGWTQRRIEAHHHEQWKHFCEEIVEHMGSVDEILIVGPGQAKHELRRQIEHHKGLRGKVLALQTASRMTENELVAHAEAFYGLEMEKELT